ncbi:MAG: ABC transporter permease [Dehalococcoidia bacterium]
MTQYILRRLLLSIPVLLVVSILVFGGVRVIPGDVCRLVLQTPEVTEEQCARVEHSMGLDQPAATQYVTWLGGVLRGDFGTSMISRRDVWQEIRNRMYLTVELAVLASTFAVLLAIPIGVYSATNQDKLADHLLRLITVGWLSIPGFWVATMLITFPAKWWGYSPPVGYAQVWEDPLKNLEQLYMPAIALGLALSASLARLTRSSMLEVLRQDYVRTARAKGLRDRVVLYRHGLKNAMLPVITLLGLQLGFLLGGTVVTESIFALPGLGTLLLGAVVQKDYTQIQGIVLFFAVIIVVINLLVDLSYAWFDPRVRAAFRGA